MAKRKLLNPPALVCLGLAAATLLTFWPVTNCEFVNYDDPDYVTQNPMVQRGMNAETIRWAFSTGYASHWHPLTWLSHALDWRLYGLNPRGHHLTSLTLHVANTMLLLLLFHYMTGALWRSALVAALFALHPLHVESVAWVSSRKDVLSAFFALLALCCYARHAKNKSPTTSIMSKWYGLALGLFVPGLLSKPMVVTLPFVMLLLDFWPLQRLRITLEKFPWPDAGRLVREKIPFLILSAASSVVTFLAQRHDETVATLDKLPVLTRLETALISYAAYLKKTFWPADLAVFYPHPLGWPLDQVVIAGLLLAGISIAVFRLRSRPYVIMGWLWFLGTLVPVIGLVQVGAQAMADRYTYVPLIGIFIMIIWGAWDLVRRLERPHAVAASFATLALVACFTLTRAQLRHWHDSVALFEHALPITADNAVTRNALASALEERGETEKAIAHYRRALELDPLHDRANYNLANCLAGLGRLSEAVFHYRQALKKAPDSARIHNNLAVALVRQGNHEEAVHHFLKVVELDPNDDTVRLNLALAFSEQGRTEEAMTYFREVLRVNPDNARAHYEAGLLKLRTGNAREAVEHWRKAVKLVPDQKVWLNNLAWLLATHPDPDVRNGREAVTLATRVTQQTHGSSSGLLDTLAAAYAESGQFERAIATAEKAHDLARSESNTMLAAEIASRLALYRSGQPYRE